VFANANSPIGSGFVASIARATDFAPIEQLRLQKLQGGDTWHLFGEIISAEVGG
jgi:hypothetical protein